MRTLYARAIWLRNCGRFTHISSDFGSQYHTHTFVTAEALYASLTRGVTWRHRGRFIDLEEDAKKPASPDYFLCDYDIVQKQIWFTPGIFVDDRGQLLIKQYGVVDISDFNVISEGYPGTGGDKVDGGKRPSYVPTFGNIESILPDHRMLVHAISPKKEELSWFQTNQIFLLGKKRTMMQIVSLSEIVLGEKKHGICHTSMLQVAPSDVEHFGSFNIIAATMRYLILQGVTRDEIEYITFSLPDKCISLPEFYLAKVFIHPKDE